MKYFKIMLRFFMEVGLTIVLLPLIVLVLEFGLINYIIMFKNQGKTVLDAIEYWGHTIEKGISMNIDFIVNGL